MLIEFGFGALVITFVLALYGIGAAIYGARRNSLVWIESARYAMLLTWPLITLSVLSLIVLLITSHFEVAFVYNVSSQSMPLYLKITALWGGQSGSLVFWSWLMSAFTAATTLRKWERDREFLPWVIVVSLVTLAFFLGLAIFVDNPFVRFWQTTNGETITALFQPAGTLPVVPGDGQGLNPLLRHPGMIFHPPMLYLGFVAFVIPYAFAMAALITRRNDDRWIVITRRWYLAAWLFLSLGLLLGSRWSYDVLGWGGYWAWDPVEVAALMPWLSGTAFLHSVMIQEKRGQFKRWNIILIVLTYSLVIIGTFLTRSGLLSSVHAFSQSSIGPLFFGFIGVSLIFSLGLLLYRWNDLRDETSIQSPLSRESLFLFNNLLFMGILAVCFLGVFFPMISELITSQKMMVGPQWFKQNTGPLFGGLLLLMGIAPLSAWGHSTVKTLGKAIWKPALASLAALIGVYFLGVHSPLGLIAFWLVAFSSLATFYEMGRGVISRKKRTAENLFLAFWRLVGYNRRRYGSYTIHLGVVLMAVGIIGMEFFQTETQVTVPVGGKINLSGYTVTYLSIAEFDTTDGRNVTRAVVSVDKNGHPVGELYPRRDYYYDSQQPVTIPGVRSTMEDDLYVLLVDWQPISTQSATFKIYHNPLINWLWLGGLFFVLGTLLAVWPETHQEDEDKMTKQG
jgi:cytochrome c-type biogenesis protein CcmF